MLSARSVRFALFGAGVLALCVAASCSEDGVTTTCPPLPLYQTYPLGDASRPDAMTGDSGASEEALAAAVAVGCATAPNGEGSVSVAGSSAAGGSNHGGSAGVSGFGGLGSIGGLGGLGGLGGGAGRN